MMLSFIAMSASSGSKSTANPPDFAFPKQVSKNAESQLKTALKSNDYPLAVRSILDYGLAQSAIAQDNLPKLFEIIADTKTKITDPAALSMLTLVEARVYTEIYTKNKYVYNNRALPLQPLPSDYNEWSGEQFRLRISTLCNEAISNAESLKNTSIKDYYSVITHDNLTQAYFPTLYDFAAYNTISLRKELTEFVNMFPILMLCPERVFIISPRFVPKSTDATKILDTYADLLKFHANDVAPLIYADLQRLQFVNNGLYYTYRESSEENSYANLLQELYERFKSSEFSGDILLDINEQALSPESELHKWYYSALKNNIEKYPSYYRIGCLQNILTEIEAKSLSASSPQSIYPDKEFPIQLSYKNVKQGKVTIYRLPDTFTTKESYSGPLSALKIVNEYAISSNKQIPFTEKSVLKATVSSPGYYIIVPYSEGIERRKESYPIVHCSRLTLARFNTPDKTTVIALDPVSGAPIEDAEIKCLTYERRASVMKSLGHTDANGFLSATNSEGQLYVSKGTDIYADDEYAYFYQPRNNNADSIVSVFTELPLYRPGDNINFAVIGYQYKENEKRLLPHTDIYATLFNTNSVAVDTVKLKTDEFGRANGSMKIPAGELTGRYMIAININNIPKNNWGNNGTVSFMVSDYKLPTFEITAQKALTDTPVKGDVTLRGTVKTYSGVPLSNQNVMVSLGVSTGYYRWSGNEVQFYTDTVTTDKDGNWKMELTSELFNNSPAPDGFFTASISSTSSSGETQQTQINFTRTAKYIISTSLDENINVANPVKLKILVTNSANEPVNMPLSYKLCKDSTIVRSGELPSNNMVNFNGISGRYQLTIYLTRDTTASTTSWVNLYTPNDAMPPVTAPVWIPNDNKTEIIERGSKYTLLYGTPYAQSHVLYLLSANGKMLDCRWINPTAGMHKLDIELPKDVDEVNVKLMSVCDMDGNYVSCNIKRRSAIHSLDIRTETFRDKLVPGDNETWTFRTVNENGLGKSSAVLFDLYNAAINAVQKPEWRFNPKTGFIPQLNVSVPNLKNNIYIYLSGKSSRGSVCPNLIPAAFNLYSRSFVGYREEIFNTMRLTSAPLARGSMKLSEHAVADEMKEETVEEIAYKAESVDTGVSTEDSSSFEYRSANITTGIWMPELTSDAEGNVAVTFTVPNANTTWQMFLTAYDKELNTATANRLVISSKPVMVQPNLPRFLRTGDKAILKALVMNNSDSISDITTIVEIFDPINSTILSTRTFANILNAGENTTVSLEVQAPMNSPFIGYRVKSSTTRFSDGEQALIPILPASNPVIETKPFYLAPDSSTFSMNLPTMPDNAVVSLQYCDNPLWYVVTALPGLAENEPSTAIGAAYNIFSAAVARGILNSNPTIAEAIKYWSSSEKSDSTLVSMLERNADLKTVLLKATPWIADARSDSERMTRLALLLDNSNIESTISAGVKLLEKLSCADGGFAWFDQSTESSSWATAEVLACLGRVNTLGFLPESQSLRSMIKAGLEYIERETIKDYKRYPKADYFSYVMLRDAYPEYKQSAQSNVITNATVQRTLRDWRKFSVGHKAEAVLMLYNHNYKSAAATIIQSLKEYSEYKPEQGMWWPSVGDTYGGSMIQLQITADALEAFHKVEPASADIDRIRQWLILQKEAENWGSTPFTTDVISSILLTSPSWSAAISKSEISLNGTNINLPEAEKYSGYLRTNISALHPSDAILSIKRQGNTPAFGAIFCQFTQNMSDIKAQSCDAVSIDKKIQIKRGNEVVIADSLAIGDKVQVLLTIHVNRDMQYVAITDERPACFEPVEQLPAPIFSEGVCFYRENKDSSTRMFITNLPKGTYQLTYDMWVNNAGEFSSGIASLQSQYAPQLAAHSSGTIIEVK